ncbi:MAG: UbiD family decarboxylase [Thermoleophilia bacterium]
MAFADLRAAIQYLREAGNLLEVTESLSPRHEVAAVLDMVARETGGAVLFTGLADHAVPVVANVIHERAVLAAAMGVGADELVARFAERVTVPIDPVSVADGPVLEVTVDDVDLALLPILTHYEADSGPYLTTGMASVLNPDTGTVERTICRMELRGRDRLGMAFVNPPLADTYRAHGRDVEMPVAVTVGLEPATFVSAALPAPPGAEKLAYAGGLRQEALEVVAAPLTGLTVPAWAEFVLEGVLVPGEEREDGPFGEISGYSMLFPPMPTFEVRRLHHRRSPVFHALLPTGPEGDLITALTVEAAIVPQLRRVYRFAGILHFVPGTFGMSLVVQVASADKGRVRGLLYHLLSLERIKKVVLVAEDVDPTDAREVEWSVITRMQPDRDLVVIDDVFGHPIDPSCGPGQRTARLGIDATGFERVGGRVKARVSATAAERAAVALARAAEGR